jgi:hypothetical protein
LTVNKHATFNSGVTVNSGDLTITSGNLNISGDLNVTGNSYLSGELWILGPSGPCKVACSGDSPNTFNKYSTFNNGVAISGDLVVSGSTTLGNTNITGDLSVSGCIKSYQCVSSTSSAAYTLSAGDFGKIIHYNPGSPGTITLPSAASLSSLSNGWQTTIMNVSSNEVTITGAGGVTFNSFGNKITGQYQAATVYYYGADTWFGAGALSS